LNFIDQDISLKQEQWCVLRTAK